MTIDQIALTIFSFLNLVFGVHDIPKEEQGWAVVRPWVYESSSGMWVSEVSSKQLVSQCHQYQDKHIVFPTIIQGGYEIFLDSKLIRRAGNTDVSTSTGYYGVPELTCNDITNGQEIKINFYSYLKYYSRISFFPYLEKHKPFENFISKYLGFAIGICLAFFSIYSIFFFYNRVDHKLAVALFFANIFLSIYLLSSAVELIPVHLNAGFIHKFGLTSLLIGAGFLIKCLESEKLLFKNMLNFYIVISTVGILIMLTSNKSDTVQLGTHMAFLPTLVGFSYSLINFIRITPIKNIRLVQFWQLLGIALLLLFAFNDIFVVLGVMNSPLVFSFGILCCLFFLMLSINQRIVETYKERDYLRVNLEKEVERKTSELKSAQAELVQSAKLASLGTLAAGIAHEINNSVNYVNGAMVPLEKIIDQQVSDEKQKVKTQKLISVMKEGLGLTVDIIKSLRNYTGLNQAQFNDVNIKETVDSVLAILKNRLRENIKVEMHIDPSLKIFGSVVGLNQIFMNIISNSLDAMPNGGLLAIKSELLGQVMKVEISDTGVGISKDIIERIFDPFFTTKGVGKGTGLGLHIVQKELTRHKASVDIKSEVGKGTTFTLKFPISDMDIGKNEAA